MPELDDAWYEEWKARMEAGGGNIILTMGMRPVEITPERVVMQMPHSGAIQQGTRVIAAGALMQLADVGATSLYFAAAEARGEQAAFPLSVQISMNLLRNVDHGMVRSTSTFAHNGRMMTVVESRVHDEDGRLLCVITSTHVAAPQRPP